MSHWQALQPSQRLAWDRQALTFNRVNRLGRSRPASGFNLFVEFHATGRFSLSGFTANPPHIVRGAAPYAVGAIFNSATYEYLVGVSIASSDANHYTLVYGARTFRLGTPLKSLRFKLIASVATALMPYDIFSPWYSRLGQLSSGEGYAVQFRCAYNNELYSPPIFFASTAL
jgi:hypothetical protein